MWCAGRQQRGQHGMRVFFSSRDDWQGTQGSGNFELRCEVQRLLAHARSGVGWLFQALAMVPEMLHHTAGILGFPRLLVRLVVLLFEFLVV